MPAMQWGRAFQRSLALLVVASLLLSLFPIPVIASPTSPITTVLQQEGTPVPEPVPPPQWPEVGERAQYVPGAADLGSPEVLPAEPAVAVELQTEMEAFSAAAPAVPDLVLPAEPLEIVLEGGVQTAQMGGLPLALQTGDTVTGEPLTARVQMLQPEQAQEVSPLGLAFALQLQADAAGAQPLSASQSLTLVIDYSRIPSAQVSDVSSRLALYRASGCAVTPVALEADMLVPGNADELAAEALPPASIACTTWEQLPSYNDFAAQQLLAQLPEVTVTGAAPAPVTQGHTEPQAQPPAPQIYLPLVRGGSNAPSAQNTAPILPEQAASLLYLPLVSNRASSLPAGDQPSAVADTLYVLSTSASGANGDYSATPFNAVDDYQVGLFAGTFATSYPIAAPPAAAGAAPEISLVYDSGSAEGRSPIKNNQPGIVGMGWDLNTGAITRLFRACDPPIYTVPATLSTTLCPVASGYALTLNGISSRLIGQGNNRFRLQHDPLWQAELLTSTSVIHPDLTKRYWLVTTPDGVRYRFGGEEEPETGADQNSVFSANMGDGTNTWRWSLDRIEDPNGNIASYFYTLERSTSKGYIRAGHLNRIEYSKHTGRNTQPHARVLFNRELRCVNPANLTDCDTGDFYDTPLDLKCLNLSSGQCPPGPPSFWSQWRLDSIQTQIYDQGSGLWRTVTFYDLSYIFAGGNFYYRPMLLNSIIQRPGGNYQRTAFGHIEAPTYDSQSGALTL